MLPGLPGASTNPCVEIYQGIESASEPETRALMGLARRYDPFLSYRAVKQASEPETRDLMGLATGMILTYPAMGRSQPQSWRPELSWDWDVGMIISYPTRGLSQPQSR